MMNATYSPEDNKLRLYASARLDDATYIRVKSAGFRWAPKQGFFVAPMWTPARADLVLDLCGDIGDEDTSLVDRAEERAERFGGYRDNRAEDAEHARAAVSAIADNIPLGQPILVGHHSEKHARRDAAKIENGMRRAVKMWETAEYWKSRAAGAIRHAKYKERPDVRARRIKGLEVEQRKRQRQKSDAEKFLRAWERLGQMHPEQQRAFALAVANRESGGGITLADGSHYWSAWGALDENKITPDEVRAQRLKNLPELVEHFDRWLAHIENRLTYERAMLAEAGGTVADRTGPEAGGGVRCWASPRGGWSYVQKVNRVSVTVLDNWGNGGGNFTRIIPFDKLAGVMSAAQVEAARTEGRLVESGDKTGFFVREPERGEARAQQVETIAKNDGERIHSPPAARDPQSELFAGLADQLRAGVKVAVVPQLFETPAALAGRMAELADIQDGHRILEPSAGTGRLVRAILATGKAAHVVAVEINAALVDGIRRAFDAVEAVPADFLACNGDLGTFDRILMNPPFINGADVAHVVYARGLLNPGGRLVAICANGPRQRDKLLPLVEATGGTWEDLPPGTFRDSGTNVSAALIVIEGQP